MRFESAIEAQRHKEVLANNDSLHSQPILKLDRDLEKHGRDIYTRENIYIFQNELWIACVDCGVESKKEKDGVETLDIVDNSLVNRKLREVVYTASNHNAICSWKMFQSEGIPCRHILCVLKVKGINALPSHYIVNRWTKLATSKPVFGINDKVFEGCSEQNNESQLISNAWDYLFTCMHLAGHNKEKLQLVINGAIALKKQLTEFEDDSTQTKAKEVESFIGCDLPKEVEIHPPRSSKTKGSGKRIKGGKEQAIEQQQKKAKRRCNTCQQYVYHDSRNCPTTSTS
jgi:hypothetical protein